MRRRLRRLRRRRRRGAGWREGGGRGGGGGGGHQFRRPLPHQERGEEKAGKLGPVQLLLLLLLPVESCGQRDVCQLGERVEGVADAVVVGKVMHLRGGGRRGRKTLLFLLLRSMVVAVFRSTLKSGQAVLLVVMLDLQSEIICQSKHLNVQVKV